MKPLFYAITLLAVLCAAAGGEENEMTGDNRYEIRSIAPTMHVRDVSTSLKFYRDVLGFRVEHATDDPPVYAVLSRDSAGLHLARDAEKAGKGGCWLMVEGVDAVYAKLDRSGADFARRIEDSPYGMRDFVVRDPDGNTLGIGEPIRK